MQIPLAKNIKRYISLKTTVLIILILLILVSSVTGVLFSLRKDVSIYLDGKVIALQTMKSTVEDALGQAGVKVNEYDYISEPLDSKLQRKNNNIYIKYAVPVNVFVDGKAITLMSYKETVGDILLGENIQISDNDIIADELKLDDKVTNGMDIKIVRVTQETALEQIPVPYGMDKVPNNKLDSGTERIVREGKEGIQEKLYKVLFLDGVEVARNLLRDAIVSNPVNAIMEYGTVLTHKPARGDTFRYKKVLDVKMTAYNAEGCGVPFDSPIYGLTASGMKAVKGVIAVDPNVIPLGTRVYVEIAGSTPDYGYAIAADTGGAIKGNIIDLYFETWGEAVSFGLKHGKVYILSD